MTADNLEVPMRVEPLVDSGHPAGVLAKMLVDAIEAKVREGSSYAEIARTAGMSRQQLANLKLAVTRDENHRIRHEVAERLAAALGLRVRYALEPAAPESVRS